MAFSVAPTLGIGRAMPAPCRPSGRGTYQVASALVYLRAKGPESHQVKVYRPWSQLAATGHTEPCRAAAGQQRAQEDNRAAQLPHEPVRYLRAYGRAGNLCSRRRRRAPPHSRGRAVCV